MGIIGTWEGFVVSSYDVYNRGTWGIGYNINNIIALTNGGWDIENITGFSATKTAESSAIRFVFTKINDTYYTSMHGKFMTTPINLTPYKTINFTVSNIQGYQKGRYSNDWIDLSLRCFVSTPTGQLISEKEYYYGGKTDGNITPPSKEITSSIDISNINITAQISVVLFYLYNKNGNISTGETHTAYLHRLWFT